MFRVLQRPSVPLLTFAAVAAGVFVSVPAQAESIDFKDGQSAVAVRFADECDGGTKVEVPNPYKTGNLVFNINAVVVVLGPGQQHSENVPAPTGGAELVVHVEAHNAAGKTQQIVHNWSKPNVCTTDTETEDPAGTNSVMNAEPDDQGYGPDGDASDVSMGANGSATDGSAVSGVDQMDPVSSTATGVDAASEAPALAVTGTSIIPMLAVGLAMLAGGAVLLRARRRKIQFKVD